ncbi:MAG: DUF308 domain-containing protein [Methanobacteriaceae archaeon]
MEQKSIVGILAIIFGILIMVFPFIGLATLAVIAGVAVLLFGIMLAVEGTHLWAESKALGVAYIILAIIALFLGIQLLGNVFLFTTLSAFYFYIAGFFLMITGIMGIISRNVLMTRGSAALIVVLGILTVILGYLSFLNPIYLAIILGVGLVIDGITTVMDLE